MGNLHPSREESPKGLPIIRLLKANIPREKGMEMGRVKGDFSPSNVGQSLAGNPKIASNSVQTSVVDNSEVY